MPRRTIVDMDQQSIRNQLHPKRRYDHRRYIDNPIPSFPPLPGGLLTRNGPVQLDIAPVAVFDSADCQQQLWPWVPEVTHALTPFHKPAHVVHEQHFVYIQYQWDWSRISKPRRIDVRYAHHPSDGSVHFVSYPYRRVTKTLVPSLPPKVNPVAWHNAVYDDAVVYESLSKTVLYVGDPVVAEYIVKKWAGTVAFSTKRTYQKMLRDMRGKAIRVKHVATGRTMLIAPKNEVADYLTGKNTSKYMIERF